MKDYQWKGIVKVQAPIFTTERKTMVLIYSENNEICQQILMKKKDVNKLLDPDYPKAYYEAVLHNDGIIEFIKEVEEQSW